MPDSDRFPEWAEVRPSDDLRQGDVLEAIGPSPDTWSKLLIVITADCDIAQSKFGGALSCISVLTCSDYLIAFRFDALRESMLAKLVARLIRLYAKSESQGVRYNISSDRLRSWILESEAEDVIRALSIQEPHASQFREACHQLTELTLATPSSVEAALSLLAPIKHGLGESRDLKHARTLLANDFASSLNPKSLPGDALFLNQLSPGHTTGYVAYLRRIVEVPAGSIAVTQHKLGYHSRYTRLTRLRAPYVYALSQQFGSIFTAIGLPRDYESARDVVIGAFKTMGDEG